MADILESEVVAECHDIEVIIESVTNVIDISVLSNAEIVSGGGTVTPDSGQVSYAFDIDVFRENINAMIPPSVKQELVKKLSVNGFEDIDEFIKKVNLLDSKIDNVRKILGIV